MERAVGGPELKKKSIGLTSPAKGALDAALLEVQNCEPIRDMGSRFSRGLIHQLRVGRREELLSLAETARVDQRLRSGYKDSPRAPRFVSCGYRFAIRGRGEQCQGLVETTEPTEREADDKVCNGERSGGRSLE